MLTIEAVSHMPAIFMEIYYLPKISMFYSMKISDGNASVPDLSL